MKGIKIDLRIIKLIFIGVSILLFVLSISAYYRIRNISSISKHLIEHSNARDLLIDSYYVFKDIEISSREYSVIGDYSFLSTREKALGELPIIIHKLKFEFAEHPIQQYYFNKLTKLYTDRITALNQLMAENDTARYHRLIRKSPQVIEQSHLLMEKVLLEENKSILLLNEDLSQQLSIAPPNILLLIIFFIFIMVVSYLSLSKQLTVSNKLQKNYEESNLSLEIANMSLAHSQAFLHSILESNPNGILVYEAIRDSEGIIEDFQVKFAAGSIKVLGGLAHDSIIGSKISTLYPSLKSTDFYDKLILVNESGKPLSFEFYYPDDGKIGGWFEISMSKLDDGVTLSGRDISNIKFAEKELMRNIELLNDRNKELDEQKNYAFTVFNAMIDSIVTVDEQMRITSANSAYYNHTETNESIIGQNIDEVHGKTPYKFDINFLKRALQGEVVYVKEYLSKGLNKYLDIYVIPLKNNLGKIYGAVSILHNIDEQVRANQRINSYVQELKQANEQLKHFTFISSHDLQEPLRKIQIFSNRLIDKCKDYKSITPEIIKIYESATRMSELILGITKYSRLQVDSTVLQLVDLNQLCQQVLEGIDATIKEKHAIVHVDSLPTIYCDPIQISQLFLQLISNSLKFCKNTPAINIECIKVDGSLVVIDQVNSYSYYRLRFIDNGIGFKNEYADKLFVIFQRLHDYKSYPGTGVGLALCHKIVENHKGKISAYSSENEGSTFDVYLPENLSYT